VKYRLLIYDDEKSWRKLSEIQRLPSIAEYLQFTQQLRSTAQYGANSGLHPSPAATGIRGRRGKPLVTDGSLAETREQLLGSCRGDRHRHADPGGPAGGVEIGR
jgi:hypothetical protein